MLAPEIDQSQKSLPLLLLESFVVRNHLSNKNFLKKILVKWSFIWHICKIFRKTNISYPLVHTRTCIRTRACTFWYFPGTFFLYIYNCIAATQISRNNCIFSEAATGGVLWIKVFLEISQNSQENTCVSFLIKLLRKRLWHRRFSVNFAKFLRTRFLQNTSGRLFLYSFIHISWTVWYEKLKQTRLMMLSVDSILYKKYHWWLLLQQKIS